MKSSIIIFMFISLSSIAARPITNANTFHGSRGRVIVFEDYCHRENVQGNICKEWETLTVPSMYQLRASLHIQKDELIQTIEESRDKTEQNMMDHFEVIVQERIKDDVKGALENSVSDSSKLKEIIRSIVREELNTRD